MLNVDSKSTIVCNDSCKRLVIPAIVAISSEKLVKFFAYVLIKNRKFIVKTIKLSTDGNKLVEQHRNDLKSNKTGKMLTKLKLQIFEECVMW